MAHRCIQLWSGPRNVSTALMYSFAQRADTRVWDEPLYAHYLRVTGLDHPGRVETLARYQTDGERVIEEMLHGDWDRPWLVCKQMGHHLIDLREDWLEKCENLFLIRHPAEVIHSFSKVIPQPTLLDIGIERQWQLFQRLQAREFSPLVVDGNEILKDPAGVLAQVCERLGMPVDPAMLQWQAGPRPEDGSWAKYWYHRVHASTGFAAYEPRPHTVREDLVPLLEAALPSYEALASHGLRANQ